MESSPPRPPPRSHKATLLGLFAVQVPALVCLGVRVWGRWQATAIARRQLLGADDYLTMVLVVSLSLLFACVLSFADRQPLFVGFLAIGQYAAVVGFGVDVWTLSSEEVVRALRAFYAAELLYLAVLAVARLAVLALYVRVFAGDSPDGHFRAAAMGLAVWVAGSGAAFVVLTGVCGGVARMVAAAAAAAAAATATADTGTGTGPVPGPRDCPDVRTLALGAGATGIAQDVAILVLPVPTLVRLWRRGLLGRGLGPGLLFSLGAVAVATSATRLWYVARLGRSADPTWDDTDSLMWSGVEVSATVVVASVPAMRAAVQGWWRRREERCRGQELGSEGTGERGVSWG